MLHYGRPYFRFFWILVSLLLGLPQRATAGDTFSRSEFVLITIDSSHENALKWDSFNPSSGASLTHADFGKAGEHIIMADWLGRGSMQAGVVGLSDGRVVWRVLDTVANIEVRKDLGVAGNIAVSGADFNNNGIADAAVLSLAGEKVIWTIWADLFTPEAPVSPQVVEFGERGNKFFYANPRGEGDWLGAVRRVSPSRWVAVLMKPSTGEQMSVTGLKSYAGKAPRPLPVRQRDGKDALVFPISSNGRINLYSHSLSNQAAVHNALPVNGEIVVGNFLDTQAEQIAIQTSGGFLVFNPETGTQTSISAPPGIAVDGININQLGGSVDEWSDGVPLGGKRATGSLANVCAAYSPMKYPEIFAKSNASGHLSSKDPRASGYSIFCGTQCPLTIRTGKADIFYSDGSYACSVGLYSIWEETHQPRMYGGVGGAPRHHSARIARTAARIGNGKLYLQISRAQHGPSTFCKEFGRTGRWGGVRVSYGAVR